MPKRGKYKQQKQSTGDKPAKLVFDDEEDEEEDDEDRQEETEKRYRFKYPHTNFGHEFSKKLSTNKNQFGHKKYNFYLEHSQREMSINNIAKNQIRFHKNLMDKKKPESKAKRNIKRYIIRGFTIITSLLFLMTNLLPQFVKPQNTYRKIESATDIVYSSINDLSVLLSKSYYDYMTLINSIMQVGMLLNESSVAGITMEEIKNKGIVPLLYKTISNEAGYCEDPLKREVMKNSFYFLHDLYGAGDDNVINRGVIYKVYSNCGEIIDMNHCLFSFLIRVAQREAGLKQLDGVTKNIVKHAKKKEFGPWTLPVARFIAYLSEVGHLDDDDKGAICDFVEQASQNQDKWSKDFNSMICLISKNVKCETAYQNINLNRLYKLDECIEIFEEFSNTKEESNE